MPDANTSPQGRGIFNMKFYFGIYKDYSVKPAANIAQLGDSVDSLSCEILAHPGCITFEKANISTALAHAKSLAKEHCCNFLEKNTSNYQIFKIISK